MVVLEGIFPHEKLVVGTSTHQGKKGGEEGGGGCE